MHYNIREDRVELSVRELCRLHRASGLYRTVFATAALFKIYFGSALTDYSEVVYIRLYAVVWATADRYFEFVRKLCAVISEIKSLVYL